MATEEAPSTCGCEPDLDDTHYARECDYCGTAAASVRCVHDVRQEPCPECDVSPVTQFVMRV